MAKTWDTSRTGGGTYEFSQDSQGRYTLNSVGFKGINKLDLPELKTGAAATTAADTSKKDIAALSAQTTQAFGDVAPFYYDKDEASEYIRRKEDKDRDETIAPITYAEARKRMTQDEAYRAPDTRPAMLGDYGGSIKRKAITKKPVEKEPYLKSREDWYTDVDSPMGPDLKKTIGAKKLPVNYTGESTYYKKVKEAPLGKGEVEPLSMKKVERFPPGQQFGPQKISPYQDAIMRGETGVKEGIKPVDKGFIQKIIPQKVKDKYQYAMQKINVGTKFLTTAVGIVGGPFVSGATMLMGAVKETPQNKHDKQYFNADNTGRIVTINPTTGKQENASTSLYAGMNRVSLKGNLETAGAKRIATREKAIANNPNISQKFKNDTDNMRREQNNYRKSKNEAAVKEAVVKGADVSNPAEMRAATGGGGGKDNCFLPDTPVTMLDGNTKLIKDIDIGDNVAKGGKVFAVGKLLTNDLYDYKGIKVSGSHMVNENGKWMRIRDSQYGKALGNDEHIVYAFGAEDRRILINGILFTDYFEVREQDKLIEEGNEYFENWKDYDNIFLKLEEKHNVAVLNKN
jgi:hypothetical protein